MWISSELSNRGLTQESIQQEDILLFAGTEEENPVRNLIYVIQKVTAYSETENTARISYYTYASFSTVGMTEKRVMNSDTASMQTCSYSQDTAEQIQERIDVCLQVHHREPNRHQGHPSVH